MVYILFSLSENWIDKSRQKDVGQHLNTGDEQKSRERVLYTHVRVRVQRARLEPEKLPTPLSGPQMLAAESHASQNALREFLAPDEHYTRRKR